MATAESQARSLDPDPLITLYELDLRPAGAIAPSDILRMHDGIAQGNNEITFGGKPYTPYPIKAEEFEWSTQGTLPRPKLSVSNVGGIASALCREYADLVGCILTRIQTFKRFLGGQPEANATQTLPIQKFVIERKTIETSSVCSFDLSIPSDAEGVMLPRRLIISNSCVWRYRGPECTYAAGSTGMGGKPITNRLGDLFSQSNLTSKGTWSSGTTYALNDWVTLQNPKTLIVEAAVSKRGGNQNHVITDENWWWMDVCLKKLSDCKMHYEPPKGSGQPNPDGNKNILPYGGFPGAHKVGT